MSTSKSLHCRLRPNHFRSFVTKTFKWLEHWSFSNYANIVWKSSKSFGGRIVRFGLVLIEASSTAQVSIEFRDEVVGITSLSRRTLFYWLHWCSAITSSLCCSSEPIKFGAANRILASLPNTPSPYHYEQQMASPFGFSKFPLSPVTVSE